MNKVLMLGLVLAVVLAACAQAPQLPPPPGLPPAGAELPEGKCRTDADCSDGEICVNGDCAIVAEAEFEEKKFCKSDADCICGGTDTETGSCFVGNLEYYNSGKVDQTKSCSDFCSGIAGNLETKCIAQQCKTVQREEGKAGEIRLTAEKTDGMVPHTAKFNALLFGVAENSEMFYCPKVTWDFGDGKREQPTVNCPSYGPKSIIKKEFSVTHVYLEPGVFRATVEIEGLRSNGVGVVAREPDGKTPRCGLPNSGKGNCDSAFLNAWWYDRDRDACKPVRGCRVEGSIPFFDQASCELACAGGYNMNRCVTDEDCMPQGCSGQWCVAKEEPFPEFSTCEWHDEYVCYQQGGCGCVGGRCAWNREVEVCLTGFQ